MSEILEKERTNEKKRDKEIIQILIKNTAELNNKIEVLKNREKKYIGENAKLSVEMIEYKSKLNMANMEIDKLKEQIKKIELPNREEINKEEKFIEIEKPKEPENKTDEPKEPNDPKKKSFHHIDFLEEKKRYIKNWKTLNENKMRRESKLKKPEKIEL
jgi:hypothetical protein